mmetsp:Transcript_28730/g.21413  ORF Transcript_28730/g.21413 Transcript_28730/m.21413 type:complete len:190 (+) Transcript_28730:583-1152(+)
MFAMGMQKTDNAAALNAKKLDIDFDADDFFNSFEPVKAETKVQVEVKKNTSKLVEVKEEEEGKEKFKFSMGSNQQSYAAQKQDTGNEWEAKERLMAMGNRKNISSEELFGEREQKSQEIVERYQALSGAKAISSDMFFGNEDPANGQNNTGNDGNGYNYDEYKQQAAELAKKMGENASVLKDKALDWFN